MFELCFLQNDTDQEAQTGHFIFAHIYLCVLFILTLCISLSIYPFLPLICVSLSLPPSLSLPVTPLPLLLLTQDRLGSRDGGTEVEGEAIYPRRIRRCVTEVWTVAAGQ